MNRRIRLLLMVSLILCITFTGANAYREEDLTTKLKDNLIPINTTQAGNGFEDLIPLKEIFKDKKIIGMGEATHGTAEFFQMKHRMFEFLVEEMDYRVFAIEAEFGGSQNVNDYILKGRGTVGSSLEAMKFWTWDTEEVADMIQWMKDYNDNPENERKVKFYGFDMQSVDNDIKYVSTFLKRVESPNKDNLNFQDIYIEFLENKETYIEKSSVEEYDKILQHVEVVNQWEEFHNGKGSFNDRDKYMAKNIKWILDYETKHYGNDKIMLWAHNGHVSKKYYNMNTMGQNIKDAYNEDYYSLGFDFYQGSFSSLPSTFNGKILGKLAKFNISSSPTGSYAYEMEKTNIPISFLDFKRAEEEELLLKFLSSNLYVNSIGSMYPGKIYSRNPLAKTVVRDSYDGMIFIKSTREAKRTGNFIGELGDGNKILKNHYILIFVLLVIVFVIFFILYKRKQKLNSDNIKDDKFYILDKNTEDKIDLNIIEKIIIKTNNFFNKISSLKYFIMILSIINFISIIIFIINSNYMIDSFILNAENLDIFQMIFYIIILVIETLILFVLPLSIIRFISKDKSIKLNHILILSIIITILTTKQFLKSGVLRYLFTVILYFIHSFMYCYSYGLFSHKKKNPIMKILLISIIQNIIILYTLIVMSKMY